ncbi:MAG: ASPIC/UnbV domain-containing protein, partial [Planctomycetota bacterium]
TDVTDDSGIVCPDGKGLSLIAADVEREGRISLFVGNDSTNNFYFRNRSQPGAAPSFSEEAMLTGLACDGRGRAQATMGIAADDMTSDGLLDFFITNFYADPNTLYLADASGTFADRTRELDLYDASYSLLGFGSQCLDADLDGRPDLVITNGHVDRSEATGEPDWMRPQFFWNAGTQFVEMHADELGSFFSDRFLGRALTRLDWNRDGRPDFCVCNLYHPVSLVTNTSRNTGNYLTLRLVGLTVDRDAIGTRILVEAGDDQWVHQLVAGDGYASSNDRVLTIGIAGHRKVDRLTVTWTSNTSNTFEQIPSNTSVTIIQGSPEYVNSQHTSAR